MSRRERKKKRKITAARIIISLVLVVVALVLFGQMTYAVFSGSQVTEIFIRGLAMLVALVLAGNIASPVIKKYSKKWAKEAKEERTKDSNGRQLQETKTKTTT